MAPAPWNAEFGCFRAFENGWSADLVINCPNKAKFILDGIRISFLQKIRLVAQFIFQSLSHLLVHRMENRLYGAGDSTSSGFN